MTEHHLSPSPETCHWGFFDATLPPVLTVDSGDTVVIESVSGGPDALPGPGFHVPDALLEIHQRSERRLPGHILTGPVAIRGAAPGDVLEVRIEAVEPTTDWGYNMIRPLSGMLPLDFERGRMMTIPLDADRGVARLPWGLDLPLAPFFGVMGVAPPPGWGRISSIEPRAHGGNLDNKELGSGATLFLPVHADGGLFSVGDGHGVQGDGEACVTAVETALRGRFTLTLRKDLPWSTLRARTAGHLVTMAADPDLDQCAIAALRDMIAWIVELTNLSREDAYTLCSLAADLRITQAVNGNKGVHCMLSSSLAGPVSAPDSRR